MLSTLEPYASVVSGFCVPPSHLPGKGQRVAQDLPQSLTDGELNITTNESQLIPDGKLESEKLILLPLIQIMSISQHLKSR